MIWEDIGIAFIVIAGVLLVVLGVVLYFWLKNRNKTNPNTIIQNINPSPEGHPETSTTFATIVPMDSRGIEEIQELVDEVEKKINEALQKCTNANAELYGSISEIMVQFKSISYRERQFWRITEQPVTSQATTPGPMNQNAFLMMKNNATQQQQEDIKNSDLLKGMIDEVNSYTITNNEITTKLIEWNNYMNDMMVHKKEDLMHGHLQEHVQEQLKNLKNIYIQVLNWEYKLEDMSRKARYTKESLKRLSDRLDLDTKQVLSTQNTNNNNNTR